MPRIPDTELERLKADVSLERLVAARGVVLRKHGEELLGLCPFHEDHSPSLVINTAKNLWHCLGACQTGGSVIDWVMKAEGVSFRHAVELLREGRVSGSGSAAPVKKATVTKLPKIVTSAADSQEALRLVVDYYHSTLKKSVEALAYLEKRGICSAEAIDHFKLGYSDRTLGYHIPLGNRSEGAEIRGRLQELGILRDSGHEHFRGSLVIPIIDPDGVIKGAYGRKVGERLRAGTPLHLYLPGPHRGVWNEAALMASSEVILCESLIDALTFWCAGYRNVTCSYGIEGFTADHIEAFRLYGIERVLIAYDRDDAGEKAAASLAEKLISEEGLECFRVQFPRNMDANEYALSVKPADKSLGLTIRKAVWLGKGAAPSLAPSAAPARNADQEAAKEEKVDVAISPLVAAAESCEPVATPVPAPTASRPTAELKNGEVVIELGDRRWRVRGLEKNLAYEVLRVNVLVAQGEGFHVDTFDLYNARHRQGFVKQAAEELGIKEDILKKDLAKVLLELEALQDMQIKKLQEHKEVEVEMSAADKAAAMELLKDPRLLERLIEDFARSGIVGEETNKLTGYLAAVSRKLEEPLAIVIQSSSAAGKSSLMEAILSFFPAEEQVKYSAMTGQSLFYMGETDLKHKILAIAEEEGAERASYALKLLQSEGELTIASTGKDGTTGRLITHEYRVEGPVMIFLTTTAVEIDEELLNRCIVLTVDEEREQTRAIHRLQRERQTLEGLLARRDRDALRTLHQNAQRLLRPLLVANPYAPELTFLDDRTRTRRDHMKYLTLIRAIALLHQYQRPVKSAQHQGKSVAYIDVELGDIETANRLCHQVLGRSLDELAPQTRRLLSLLDELVTQRCKELALERCDYRFTQREVRERLGIGSTQLKIHMCRLEDLEYVIAHRGGRGQQFLYELAYAGEGRDGTPFLPMLLDVSQLAGCKYDDKWSGQNGSRSGSGRPQVGPKSGGCRGANRPLSARDSGQIEPLNGKSVKNAHLDEGVKVVPYLHGRTDGIPLLAADSGGEAH